MTDLLERQVRSSCEKQWVLKLEPWQWVLRNKTKGKSTELDQPLNIGKLYWWWVRHAL